MSDYGDHHSDWTYNGQVAQAQKGLERLQNEFIRNHHVPYEQKWGLKQYIPIGYDQIPGDIACRYGNVDYVLLRIYMHPNHESYRLEFDNGQVHVWEIIDHYTHKLIEGEI